MYLLTHSCTYLLDFDISGEMQSLKYFLCPHLPYVYLQFLKGQLWKHGIFPRNLPINFRPSL